MALPEFAHSLYQNFEREGIPLLLAGGWAVCHHGYTRYTNDIDWVCSRANEARAIELMKSLGFEIVFEAMATRFRHSRHFDLLPVDLLWVSVETFARMAQSNERTRPKANMSVIDLETLLAMKINALKDHEKREGKDVLDIRFLMKENQGVMTEDCLKQLCERFAGPDAYKFVRMLP